MTWKKDGKCDWLCKQCTDKKGEHFCNFGWRAACKQCGVAKGKSHWKDVRPATPSYSSVHSGSQRIQQLEQELRASKAKVFELEKPAASSEASGDPKVKDDDKDELATLRKDVDWLQKVSGEDAAALLQAKRRRIEELAARKRAERPTYVQLKEIDEKLEKRQKALERHEGTIIPSLEEKLTKAREEAGRIREEVKQLQEQKDALLQSGSMAGKPGNPAARANDLLAQLKGLLTGPAAEPFVHTIKLLESEFSRFQEDGDDDMDFNDLDQEDEEELDKLFAVQGGAGEASASEDGDASKQKSEKRKAARAAIAAFTSKVRRKQRSKR